MKDLNGLVEICKKDLESLGVKYGKVSNWSVNSRAKCRLGQCKRIGIGLFDINISERLLCDELDDQMALNTIMHELLHTVKGCFNHNGKWKIYAEFVNEKMPNYNIKRVATLKEMDSLNMRKQPEYKYILRCKKCGQEIKRQRTSKVILNYKMYRCGKCGGRLERVL